VKRTTPRSIPALAAAAVAAAALAALAPEARAQAKSLWTKNGAVRRSAISDPIAMAAGDIVTIIVEERQQIANSEDASYSKDQNLQFVLEEFAITPDELRFLPQIDQSSSREWNGEASYNKDGRFEARIAVVVVDVQPNGNLVVEGRRRIQFDEEVKTMRVTGIVRPRDIASDNTVRSRNVANATLSYEGEGPLTRATNQGWLEVVIDFIWPF
jgi:flagellar L-ring protein precursor FlgH